MPGVRAAADTRKVPSGESRQWWAGIVLSGIGLIDSIYLTWIKLADQTASCAGIGDCEAVNTSRYSEVMGIPIALLGAAGFLAILVLLWIDRPGSVGSEMSRFALFGVTLAGTVYSAYLTYIEIAVIRAVCPFCVVSAVVMTLLFALSLVRLRLWA